MVRAVAAGQVVSAALGRLGHQPVQPLLAQRPAALEVDVDQPEGGGQGLGRLVLAGQLVAEPGEVADVGVAAGVDHHPDLDPGQPGLGGDHQPPDLSVADLGVLDEGVEQDGDARAGDQRLPDHLEVIGQVGDAGAGPVGVGPLHHRAEAAQAGHDLVGQAAHDLPGPGPRGVEAVEGVQHRRGDPAQERQLLQQQRPGSGAGGGHRRRGPGAARADDHDVVAAQLQQLSRHVLGVAHGGAGGDRQRGSVEVSRGDVA